MRKPATRASIPVFAGEDPLKAVAFSSEGQDVELQLVRIQVGCGVSAEAD